MLHVFNMDVGTMIGFDTQFAMQNVQRLQEEIKEEIGVGEADQILLVSGGLPLDPTQRVIKYNTGTSENPIFLIVRTSSRSTTSSYLPHSSQLQSTDPSQSCISRSGRQLDEFKKSYRDFLSSDSPTFELVCGLTELSRRIAAASDADATFCRQLVSEQHLLQQGWFAVVANLEDTMKTLNSRGTKFHEIFQKYLKRRPAALELLRSITVELELLARIPLLPCLIPEESIIEQSMRSSTINQTPSKPSVSLLSWISSKDSHHNLTDVIQDVRHFVDQYDESLLIKIDEQFLKMSQKAEDPNRTVISGLNRRLGELDKFMSQIQLWLTEQIGFSDHIRQLEGKLKSGQYDADLLRNQWSPLKEIVSKMIRLHESLLGVSKKFVEAKTELLMTIRSRLTWVAGVQESVGCFDGRIILLSEHLKRIRLEVDLLRQIKDTPTLYGYAIAEVVRRNAFRAEYFEWARQISSKAKVLYDDEVSLRQNVQLKLDRHFLSGMFVGLRDFPPPYCVEPPTPFDTNLPSINEADLHQLRSQCPELREILKVYSTRIFDLMRIERPKVSESEMNTICRQASFISDTPPRLILAAERGVTGSHWWSGDENLSTTIPGSLKKSQLISSPGEGQFSWDRTDNFTPAKVVIAAGPASASEVSSSRFIGSLSNAPKSFENPMGHSRQLSERSSRFGTPEEDIPPVSEAPKFPRKGSEENISGLVHVDMPLLESPPEIISKSQIFESDGQLQGDSSSQQRNARASHPRAISAPKPITAHSRAAVKETTVDPISPTQTDIVSDLGGILLDGSSSDSKENSQITLTTAKKQRSDELIESLEKQICELQSQLSLKEQIAEESQNTEVNLRKDVFEFAKTIQKFMIEFRAEMAESKDGMAALIFESEKSTGGAVTCLQEWAEKLEQKLKSDFETATGAILELKQVEFSEQLSHLNEEILSQNRRVTECSKQLELTQAYLNEREEVIDMLKSQKIADDEAWEKRLESEKLELVKQLTIDNELDMEELRKQFQAAINEKESDVLQLRSELKERDAVVMHLRSEQDRLLSSMYDHESEGRALSDQTKDISQQPIIDECDKRIQRLTEDHEQKIKGLRAEIEASYRDKLSFLQNGMEEKHRKVLERSKLERDFDIKSLTEKHHREMELMKAAHLSEIEALQTQLQEIRVPDTCAADDFSVKANAQDQHEENVTPSDGAPVDSDFTQSTCVSPGDVDTSENLVTETENTMELRTGDGSGDKRCRLAAPEGQSPSESLQFEGKVSVLKVRANDFVLVVFNERYGSYVVFTVVPILHFIDKCSYESLGLNPSASLRDSATSSSRKNWVVAKVLQVEYCVAKKDRNRYKVPKGTKFHLVKAVPYTVARKQSAPLQPSVSDQPISE